MTIAAAQPGEAPWPSRAFAWSTVGVLALGNVFAYLDRQIISLLIEPITADLGLADWEAGLLLGLAFGLFYTLLAIPIGLVVDSWKRMRVAAIGMAVWTVGALGCGAAGSFATLFAARTVVGAGEASINPASYSALSDLFPRHRLSTAIGVYTMSAFVGAAASLIVGGLALRWLSGFERLEAPFLGEIAPWQATFLLLAAPGLLIAAIAAFMPEPARRSASPERPRFADTLRFMGEGERRAAFTFLIAAFAVHAFGSYATSGWTVAFFIRTYGWEPADVGVLYGLAFLVFGAGGAVAGGVAADWLSKRGHADAQVRAALIAIVCNWPVATLSTLMPSPYAALALVAAATFFSTSVYPLAASAIQVMTPNRMRGQASAVYLTIINVIGLGMGPLAVGLMNSFGFNDPGALRYSLAIINGVTAPLMAFLLWRGLAPFRAAAARADAQ